uniref:MAK10-like protein n=1 Tax=Tanacetum cinerariifolium TaxID=118510 RepID=A0A6L2JCH9_TANCI|nr:MAK10-like protein [Tanacetum cinerariifolium]
MEDENPIRTLGDYFKPSHEGYRNTIELPIGNNVVPLRSDTIRLVQNRCSFHGLQSEDPNQYLKDFLKLVDSLNLDSKNTKRTRLRLFHSPFTIKLAIGLNDHKTLQRYPDVPTTSWRISIRSMDSFQGLTPDSPSPWHRPLAPNDLALYDNVSWNDPRDFAKLVKAIALPQDVPSTSDRRLIELETQVQRLMEAHLALTQPTQVNKITTTYEICNGPHDTQYCMENPEQAFVDYVSSRIDKAGADRTKSYPVGIFKDVEVRIGKLKLLNDFCVIDMKKDPETPLFVRRGFLATANAVIDCRMAKIAVREGITRSVFGVKRVDLGEEEAPYWTTLGKRESYKLRPCSKGVGAQTPYYAMKYFLDCHLPREWKIPRDVELNPFKDTLVFRIHTH